jgi:hypothetical protein
MAPQMARPRSRELGGSRESRAQGGTAKSVPPPSAVCDLALSAGFLDGRALDPISVTTPGVPCARRASCAPSAATPADAVLALQQVEPPGSSFPCLLSSNNSTEKGKERRPVRLSSQVQKSARALSWNVSEFVERKGLDRVGMLTLTFVDNVENGRLAQKRFNSLATHVLRARYLGGYIRVMERQKRGAWHYHLLVSMPCDIRTGVDHEAFAREDYRTASVDLRAEWAFWRDVAPRYGFGRCSLEPLKSNTAAISKYVSKYLGKHFDVRRESDKGLRLVEYSGVARIATTKFAGVGLGARNWRARVRLFASMIADSTGAAVVSIRDLSLLLGPRWAYKYRDLIDGLPV